MKKTVFRLIAVSALSFVYGTTWFISKLLRPLRRSRSVQEPKLLVIGTFHNPNWFFAHITPLTQCGMSEVILICDEPVASLDRLTYECPPTWLVKLAGRAGAKLIWGVRCSFKYKPDIYMGYHIFPAAISALLIARLFAREAVYQCTAGPLELEGGGWNAENKLLVALTKPSALVEKMVHAVVRQFDLVIVRGRRAQSYIQNAGFKNNIAIITGSVTVPDGRTRFADRKFDVIFVGRLTEYKRPDYFVEVIHRVTAECPDIKVIMVGDGPDYLQLQQSISEKGLQDNIEMLGQRDDVPDLLSKSRVFVLTSRWEGLSIAMIEAMTHGVVPVVSDVGDLRDLAQPEITGYVEEVGAVDAFSGRITDLLHNPERWEQMSAQAARNATDYSSVSSISNKWRSSLRRLLE